MNTQVQQLLTMLDMQNAMNQKVAPDWFEQGFAWYRAIWVECAEMLDHYGWKWWKHQSPDREQVKLELVDIFHFGLSLRITDPTSMQHIAEQLASEMATPQLADDFPQTLELVAASAVQHKQFNAAAFAGCMQQIEMDFVELFSSYVGKNVLNFFRQDHGYKEGSYKKVWQGKEDNEHLVELLSELDANNTDFREQVYQGLQQRYRS